MGRLAGPSKNPATIKAMADAQNEDYLRAYRAATPLVHPPAARRLKALLWLIDDYYEFSIGAEGRPPLTRDMRTLLAHRLVKMERRVPSEFWGEITERTPKRSYLVVTPAGQGALAKAKISQQDKDYICKAMFTAVAK